jgi:hypothetical protein
MYGNQKSKRVMSIRKTIRQNLLEVEGRRKSLLQESKIINSRFKMIAEGVNTKSKIQTKKALDQILSECNYLKTQNYNNSLINEGFLEVMGDLFGNEGPQFWDTIKSKLSDYLTSKFGVDGWMKDKMIQGIGNVEIEEIPNLFTDCRFLVQKMTDAAMEGFGENISVEGGNNTVPGIFRQSLDKVIGGDDFRRNLEDSFTTVVCPAMGQINQNMVDKFEGFKKTMFS